MYTINIGNGTIVNLGIDRAVAGNEVNTTALAEGTLPEGVEMYGAGWKSEYDVDDDEGRGKLGKREQLISLRPGRGGDTLLLILRGIGCRGRSSNHERARLISLTNLWLF
jgi:hypothetical protein